MPILNTEAVDVFYQQSGAGQDIVWLAGGDMPGSTWHKYQLPAFGEYRNTTYDARGVGQTVSKTNSPWPISTHAQDAIQLIEKVCDPPVFLVGLSMGQCISQEISLTRPDLVKAAVLTGACAKKTGYIKEWEDAEIAMRRNGNELPEDFAVIHYALLMYPSEVLGDDKLWQEIRPLVAQDYGNRDPLSLAEQWQACVDYDSTDRLQNCEVPLHVIAFSEDMQTPPARAKVIHDLAPNATFEVLQGLGHCSMYGHKPNEVNRCIKKNLERYN